MIDLRCFQGFKFRYVYGIKGRSVPSPLFELKRPALAGNYSLRILQVLHIGTPERSYYQNR